MRNIAELCVAAMLERVQSIADVNGKALQIYDAEELTKVGGYVTYPAAGVIYEGMRSVPEAEKATLRAGYSSELILTVCVINQAENLGNAGFKDSSMLLMDKLRDAILGKKSPTGHIWKFIVEAPAAAKKDKVIWIQRWSAPIQLVEVQEPPKVLVR